MTRRFPGVSPAGWPGLLGLLRTAFGVVFSYEMSYVLFMFGTVYKQDPRFAWIPVDLTTLFYVVNVVCGLYLLALRWLRIRGRVALLMVAGAVFCTYAAASAAWSPSRIYATYKAEQMVLVVLWSIVGAAAIIASDQRRLSRFFWLLAFFAVWISVESVNQFASALLRGSVLQAVNALGAVYLTLARSVSIGSLIVLGYLLYYARSRRARIIASLMILGLLIVLALLGGRTPFVAMIVAALFPAVLKWRIPASAQVWLRHYLLALGLALVLLLGIILYVQRTGTLPGTLERFLGEGRLAQSSALRGEFYTFALTLWANEGPLFGTGMGSWPIHTGEGDVTRYPHNIVLEVGVELGTVGLALLLALWGMSFHCLGSLRAIRGDPLRIILVMLFINALVNGLFSYDMPANRWLFAVCGLMAYGAWVSMRGDSSAAADGPAPGAPESVA